MLVEVAGAKMYFRCLAHRRTVDPERFGGQTESGGRTRNEAWDDR